MKLFGPVQSYQSERLGSVTLTVNNIFFRNVCVRLYLCVCEGKTVLLTSLNVHVVS